MLIITVCLSVLLLLGGYVSAISTVRQVNQGRQCEDLFITVSVKATNLNISHPSLVTREDYSQFVQDAVSSKMLRESVVGELPAAYCLVQASFLNLHNAGKMNVSGTFKIGATLWDPKGQKPTTIQHLTHCVRMQQ
jgi:hypothetical protein